MSRVLGCALVGAGSWGALLAQELLRVPGLELRAVVDPDPERARAAAAPAKAVATDALQTVLADTAIEAVVIAVPNDRHVAVALAAVEAGCHVLLEKPVSLTVAQLDPLVRASADSKLIVMPNHVMRYYAPLAHVRQLVADGCVGTPLLLGVERRDLLLRSKHWLQRRQHVGGMLYQSTCHEFDLLRWLGGEIVEIACLAAPRVIAADTLDYPDAILSQVRFESGAAGRTWTCMTDPVTAYTGVVTGDKGSVEFDVYDARVTWRRLDGEGDERRWPPGDQWSPTAWVATGGIGAGEAEATRALLADFHLAVTTGTKPPLSLRDGLATTELAQAGYLSIAERRPVRLPLEGAARAQCTYLQEAA